MLRELKWPKEISAVLLHKQGSNAGKRTQREKEITKGEEIERKAEDRHNIKEKKICSQQIL